MRPTCLECAGKHLAQASELTKEFKTGYPSFHWYVIGHLAEAEEETVREYPDLANEIREYRVAWTEDHDLVIPFEELLGKIDEILETDPNEETQEIDRRIQGEIGPGPDPIGEEGPTEAPDERTDKQVAREWNEGKSFRSDSLTMRGKIPDGVELINSDTKLAPNETELTPLVPSKDDPNHYVRKGSEEE